MSPEDIYLLAFDLNKELHDLADSLVNVDGHKDEKIVSPDSEDTNLDHILRWMSLVHSLKQSVENVLSSSETLLNKKPLPRSVVMVGTKADMVKDDPWDKMESLCKCIFREAPASLLKHITEERFVVDNTRAGGSSDQEDQQIAGLRDKIIELANEMPHTKQEIPLHWLSVEQEIACHPEPYVLKTKFRDEIAKKCCTLKDDDELEVLLLFLHFRGVVIYHENPEGLVVLDPKWLISIITEIITAKPKWTYPPEYDDHYGRFESDGVLSKELLDLACCKLNIGDIKNSLIFIMKKFNLMFEWKIVEKSIYLVPCMAKKLKHTDHNTCNGPVPLYLRFDTGGYVPFGLFTRLAVLFGVWASEQCSAEQPELHSNSALFFGERFQLHLECYSSVIKLYVSLTDSSDQVETNFICKNILR